MGSLVWSALAKGAGDLGNVISNGMYKQADLMFQQQKEIDADSRAMKRAEALERLKMQLEEEQDLADSKKMVEVRSKADEIAAARTTAADNKAVSGLIARQSAIAGDAPAASEQEMRDLLKDPINRKVYEDAGYIDKASTREPSLQRADDLVTAASDVGASSRVRKSLEQARKDTLAEIKAENARKRDDQRHEETMAQQDRLGRQFTASLAVQQQNADANTIRANKPNSSTDPNKPPTTADIQRQITAAQNSLATELGVAKNDVNAEVAALKRKAASGNAAAKNTLAGIQPYLDELKDANDRMMSFKRASKDKSGSPTSSGNNSNVKSNYSNLWK